MASTLWGASSLGVRPRGGLPDAVVNVCTAPLAIGAFLFLGDFHTKLTVLYVVLDRGAIGAVLELTVAQARAAEPRLARYDMSEQALSYELIDGDLHRHGDGPAHAHAHAGPHSHDHEESHCHHHHAAHHAAHVHSHGLVDESIKRSRAGLRAVGLSLLVLGAAAGAQTVIFVASGSIALLADLIHNFGDAATAIPLAVAFLLRSPRAERYAGLFVVAAIFISACVAGVEAVSRLVHPQEPTHVWALATAGLIGYGGNWLAASIRTSAGRRLDSPALIADGNHARADAYVSLAVVASATVVALGLTMGDPLIGLGITLVILKITWDSWRTVRGHQHRAAAPAPADRGARPG